MRPTRFLPACVILICGCCLALVSRAADATNTNVPPPTVAAPVKVPEPAATNAINLKNLRLPGVTINAEQRFVDVESSVCLKRGTLELVACTKETKEHESVVVIHAKAMHIHAALLLIGARPGSPAQNIPPIDEKGRWVDRGPRGCPVGVYLVFTNAAGKLVEQPISDFITRAEDHSGVTNPGQAGKDKKFPTHIFLFAGSHLVDLPDGQRRYLSDGSGDVISISTFGDELLCLPEVHSQDNDALEWQVDDEKIPAVGTKVILRLRPQFAPAKAPPAEPKKLKE